MKFHRVHVEVTNICGLACSFCPPKLSPSKTMTLEFFKKILNLSFDEYMKYVLNICSQKVDNYPKPFINLRLWNLNNSSAQDPYNQLIFEKLNSFFDIDINNMMLNKEPTKSLRLAPKVLLNFDNYFEWPALSNTHNSHASCYGLSSHIGILSDGTVVPCCLDGDGVINLGNLHSKSLKNILTSQRATNIIEGFKKNVAVEELCKKCSYKDRFKL